MRKLILLLDVDETSVLHDSHFGGKEGKYFYNDELFAALKEVGITEVELFTSYLLKEIAKNKESEPYLSSRLKLIRYLETQGIKVNRVLTLLDPVYNRGAGAYYEKVVKRYEQLVLEGNDLIKGEHSKTFGEQCNVEDGLCKIANDRGVWDKGSQNLCLP